MMRAKLMDANDKGVVDGRLMRANDEGIVYGRK